MPSRLRRNGSRWPARDGSSATLPGTNRRLSDGKLVYAVAAAGANLLGAFAVTWRARWSTRALDAMLAFAAGFIISVSLLDLFPEALIRGGRGAAIVALGAYVAVH